ncbi:Regulator of chromosome condensation 1/beta-lactamase-inhibitor protein II [Dioscorea alata]|uniref:Regulator of chromosome condensation 1/beta-lactamase-inhibitor protein II n=1 Tax=Dioscorea alata TaxID=55571 RepID=A0ACB7TW09_DIOAL|nr:Regulator of chromosome condensation 1/beta-lactamase-inhibitor protein II [Dioscorea alata]
MSRKVVQIAAGEAHTLALAGDGSVLSWGRGTFGRLGTGKEHDEHSPVRVYFPDASSQEKTSDPSVPSGNSDSSQPLCVGIAAGAYHSLALQEDGSVWSWGYNTYGQLGHSEVENASLPCLVEHFQQLKSTGVKVCSVKAGAMSSFAIDNLGGLWTWGNCPQPSNDEDVGFCFLSYPTPMPVMDFYGHSVVKVACGNEHVVALVAAGEVHTGGGDDLLCYSWGNNNHGQLGLGDTISRSKPEIINVFNQECPWSVFDISCGAFHTALLTHRKSSGSQHAHCMCWTFGLGENGQLGHGTTVNECLPRAVKGLPEDAVLVSLDCGLFHTSVVSSAGDVWSWGMEKGLGLCPDASFTGDDAGDALSPIRMHHAEGVKQVACGAAHTLVVADDGHKLWAWGRGRSGVLGHGKTTDSFMPFPVLWPPLDEDFKENNMDAQNEKTKPSNQEAGKLANTSEEIEFLRSKLTLMERYASLLHVSVFRKQLDDRNLPQSLQGSGVFDIGKELETLLESADDDELARMEMFYRNMLASVKDKLLKRRVQEMVKETLKSLSAGSHSYTRP